MCRIEDNGNMLTLGVSSLIGTRPDQQDSVYAEAFQESVVGVLCDGMGGLEEGGLASQAAIQTFAEDYEKRSLKQPIPAFLKQEAIEMDMVVHELKNEKGEEIRAGSTVAAVIAQGDELYWLSVGDSRIYILRKNEIQAVNRDHNYRLRLDNALESGMITKEIYQEEEQKAEALISYLGMGNVTLMDINIKPFHLQRDDVVILCSDGLYRTLDNETIIKVCQENLPDTQKTADSLTETAILSSLDNQDNTSVVVIQYGMGPKEESNIKEDIK